MYVPTIIPGLENVTQIVGGYFHALALFANGSVAAVGSDSFGQLGLSSGQSVQDFTLIPGLSNIVQISAYYCQSFAVTGSFKSLLHFTDNSCLFFFLFS